MFQEPPRYLSWSWLTVVYGGYNHGGVYKPIYITMGPHIAGIYGWTYGVLDLWSDGGFWEELAKIYGGFMADLWRIYGCFWTFIDNLLMFQEDL